MIICNECNTKINLLTRLKSCIKLKYIINYVPCEIQCEKCNTIYKIKNEKYIKFSRFFLFFLFLCYVYNYFKFSILQNLVILAIGCCLLNPFVNVVLSYFVKYEKI